jgi:hypothetical protein
MVIFVLRDSYCFNFSMDLILRTISDRNLQLFGEILNKHQDLNTGWGVIHYLVDDEWYDGIKKFLENTCSNINEITKDYVSTSFVSFIIGGQNCLFMARNDEMIEFLLSFGVSAITDNNGNTYTEYIKMKNNFQFMRQNYDKVKERCNKNHFLQNIQSLNNIELISKNKYFSDYIINSEELINILKSQEFMDYREKYENHKNKFVTKMNLSDVIKKIIVSIIQMEIIDMCSFYGASVFLMEYKYGYKSNLQLRSDHAKYTICICLDNTSDSSIIFVEDNIYLMREKFHLYFYKGTTRYIDTDLNKGEMKNLMIFLS